MRRCGRAAGLLAALAVLVLAGCTAGPSPVGVRTPASGSASPRPTDPVLLAAGSARATGVLRGGVTGTVVIEPVDARRFVVRLHGLRFPDTGAREAVLSASATAGSCGGDDLVASIDRVPAVADQALVRPWPDADLFEDLSFVKTFALLAQAVPNGAPCEHAAAALATLHWTRSAALDRLAPRDRGPRQAARGTTDPRHGRPRTYTAARGDFAPAVAARFGITLDDLLWLNPRRLHGAVLAGDAVNLDPARR